MSKVRIPKQLFVVNSEPRNKQDPSLGFLHEYSPHTATGKKKMDTQLEWAYRHKVQHGRVIEEDSGQWILHGKNYVYDNKGGRNFLTDVSMILPPEIAPQIWENEPLDGFKILTSVSRYSTSNKLWRVLDPRGLVFEVSTDNLEKIILNSTIIDGEIQSKCVWVGNKNLALAE